MESIYGPPASKRPRKRVAEAPRRSLRWIEVFWLCVLGVLCFAALVALDEGDPDIAESLRRLEQNQRLLDDMRVPPVHIDLPIFEPLQTAEIIQNQPVPADATPPTRTPTRDAPLALQTAEVISAPPAAPRVPARQRPAEPEPEPDEPGRLQSAGIIRR